MTTEATRRDKSIQQLAEIIEGIKIAMLTTKEPDGHLHSRPMAVQQVEFDGDLWFFTRDDAPKVEHIQHDNFVNVIFAKPDDQTYLTMEGRAALVKDREKNEELWSTFYKAWFPDGLGDPHLALLRVEVERAEYWDSPSSPVVHLVGLAKSVATGSAYEGEVGSDHEKVDL